MTRKLSSLIRCIGAVVLMTGAGTVTAGVIAGSAHDFSSLAGAGGNICLPCHTPHRANLSVTDAPLWNHALTTQAYVLYTSPTLNATVGQPGGNSRLCLSCHDGSVAVGNFGTNTGATNFIAAGARIGTGTAPNISLRSEHPIGMTYDAALVTADGSLRAVTTAANIGAGTEQRSGTIASNLLFGGRMECASCHDVHNRFVAATGGSMLKIAPNALCTTCHAK